MTNPGAQIHTHPVKRASSPETSDHALYSEQVGHEAAGKKAKVEGLHRHKTTPEKLPGCQKYISVPGLGAVANIQKVTARFITIDEPEGIYYGGN